MVEMWVLAVGVFLVTVVFVLWRPGGIHEAVPALAGALLLFLVGLVGREDVLQVLSVTWNSAMTIIATFVMASVLEGAGFFTWVTNRLIERAGDSGQRLFHLVLAFSACLTLFLNNDGSILLGTPLVLGLVRQLRLPRHAAFGFLLSACLIASAASPPIGVSNMANLEAMSLVGISLTQHLQVVLFPALLGLGVCWGLLHLTFGQTLQADLGLQPPELEYLRRHPHEVRWPQQPPFPPPPALPHEGPLARHLPHRRPPVYKPRVTRSDPAFMWVAVSMVIIVRIGFFVASVYGVPTYVVAMTGAAILLIINQFRRVVEVDATIRRAPWAIFGFAVGMDLVVFGLRNAGVIGLLAGWLEPVVRADPSGAAAAPGLLAAVASSLLNNHPGLIIGSLTLLEMGDLPFYLLDIAYSSLILGTDLGALITPVGTLASLIWLHLLRQDGVRISWWEYSKVTMVVIPLSFACALLGLVGQAWLAGR